MRLDRFLFWCRTALASGLTLLPAHGVLAQEPSFSRCYGTEIDLIFVPLRPQNQTRMTVPTEFVNILQTIKGEDLFFDSPCRPEPLTVRQLQGGFAGSILSSDEPSDGSTASSVRPRRYHIVATEEGATQPYLTDDLDRIEANGIDQPGGLRITEDQGEMGGWALIRFPSSYRDPRGNPVVMACPLICAITYPLTPTLRLRYEIANYDDKPITERWVDIDRDVRAMLLSWIKEEYGTP